MGVAREFAPATRSEDDRRKLIGWATDCAMRVLSLFEKERPGDRRPRSAIEGGLAWRAGDETIGAVRSLAFDAHAAARDTDSRAATAAARAAGHAAAVAHMAGHAVNAAKYALKAVEAFDPERVDAEEKWQRSSVPPELATFVYSDDR